MRAKSAAWWFVSDPGIPLKASFSLSRPQTSLMGASRRPPQLAFMAICSAGLGRIAGVHSIVWILAISAAFTSRAVWKIRSSGHSSWFG